MKHRLNKRGFTLLELLIVVAIIAVLIALALPFYQDYIEKSKYTATLADLSSLRKAVQMYEQVEQASLTLSDLRPLIGKYIEDFRKNNLLQLLPRDAYGNDYSINPTYGLIISYGPDHKLNMTASDWKARRSRGDDLVTAYLPPFYLMRVSPLNRREFEVEFSRKILTSSISTTNFYWLHWGTHTIVNAGDATERPDGRLFRISPTIFRFRFTSDTGSLTAGGDYRLYVDGISAQTGRSLSTADSDDQPGYESSSSGGGSNSGCWVDFSVPAS
ncbi:MAG: prepilin-type N-terminal cleavage/methylation domain-containing protein [Candidatus Riflebacteria bacterium]|nr:prepilin-type N-terminal cleavage/methylation domain-containing protein [Candidatus Riflebacteria bacterium]